MHPTIILRMLTDDETFRKEFIDNAPSITSDVVAYVNDSTNTEAKTVIEDYIKGHSNAIRRFAHDYNRKSQTKRNHKIVMGDVVEISQDPMEYKQLIDTAQKEGWRYKGLTVMTNKDKWLVFFF